MSIFIPGQVPSLKNSKRIVWCHGRTLIIPSKSCVEYMDNTIEAYEGLAREFWSRCGYFAGDRTKTPFKEPPYIVKLTFVRTGRQRFDYINAAQVVFDLMVKARWLVDDSAAFVIPAFGQYRVDKKNPGVEIEVL